jgi:hypothetical protein
MSNKYILDGKKKLTNDKSIWRVFLVFLVKKQKEKVFDMYSGVSLNI